MSALKTACLSLLSALVLVQATPCGATDMIEGLWRTKKDHIAEIKSCDAGYCITLKDSQYAGTQIGVLRFQNGEYEGQITDPANHHHYIGKAKVTDKALKLQGCMLFIICVSQVWTREP